MEAEFSRDKRPSTKQELNADASGEAMAIAEALAAIIATSPQRAAIVERMDQLAEISRAALMHSYKVAPQNVETGMVVQQAYERKRAQILAG